MFRPVDIMLPTDFSHYALYALSYAIALAQKTNGTIHLAHVLDSSILSKGSGLGYWLTQSDADRVLKSMQEHAESRLEHLVKMVEDESVSARHYIVKGKPWTKLLRLTDSIPCDTIIIATHGRTGFERFAFGSVCEKITRHANVPVLCIKHPEHEFVAGTEHTIQLKRVMFPTDFSEFSEKVLPYATSLCREYESTLILFHANELAAMLPEFMPDSPMFVDTDVDAYVRERMEGLRAQVEGIPIEAVIKTGVPYREICKAVDEQAVDLVVIPTHGRSGIVHRMFGSVTNRVVRGAPCPVLTIRPEYKSHTRN